MNEKNLIEDASFEEIIEDQKEVKSLEENNEERTLIDEQAANTTPLVKPNKEQLMETLKNAVESGAITKAHAANIRREMGIFKTDFTKTKTSKIKRKNVRQAQKQARKKQRK